MRLRGVSMGQALRTDGAKLRDWDIGAWYSPLTDIAKKAGTDVAKAAGGKAISLVKGGITKVGQKVGIVSKTSAPKPPAPAPAPEAAAAAAKKKGLPPWAIPAAGALGVLGIFLAMRRR